MSDARKSWLCVVALWLLSVAGTVGGDYVLPVTQDRWWYQLLVWASLALPIASWVIFDGRARGYEQRRPFAAAALVMSPIAVPVYVWRTRGAWGLVKWLLWTALLIVSALLACFVSLLVLPDPDWAV